MQIVIDIPEDNFKRIRELAEVQGLSDNLMGYSLLAIAHGIVLPKGHGRLIDADAVLEEPYGNTYKDIDIAETIIEADKG